MQLWASSIPYDCQTTDEMRAYVCGHVHVGTHTKLHVHMDK